jgi:hypothetical protein
MESIGHRIKFTVDNKAGYIEIKRGWMRFEYNCYIDNNLIIESTGQLAVQDKDIFKVSLEGTSTTLDHKSGDQIVWYIVKTIRLEDKVYMYMYVCIYIYIYILSCI